MVRVISVHHFTSEEVTTASADQQHRRCSNISGSCSAFDQNLLLVSYADESPNIEVRSLSDSSKVSHRFRSIDPVQSLVYAPVGQFLLFLETPEGSKTPIVRVYVNWSDPAIQGAPCLPRIAGAVSPGSTAKTGDVLDVIEFRSIKGCPPLAANACPSTGNVAVAYKPQLIVIYSVLLSSLKDRRSFLDFREIIHIYQSFSPREICLVEDLLGVLSPSEFHLFKIKIRDTSDERTKRSLSVYSFGSDSTCPRQDESEEENTIPRLRHESHNNITLQRQEDSETSNIGHLDGYVGNVLRHKDHKEIDSPKWEKSLFPEVEEANKEYFSLGSPKIMDQVFGPFLESPQSTSIKVVFNLSNSDSAEFEAECLTLLRCNMLPSETQHEAFQNLQISPVYWKRYKVKVDDGPHKFSHPLHSPFNAHCMSFSVCFTSFNEGYLYHVPGHLRKPGRGLGVQRIATYPFTAPVMKIALEPSLLHALTETGLETYTLRSGYYTVLEVEQPTTSAKFNACPGGDVPICLVGLRPFQGAKFLNLSLDHLVLISGDDTITNLKLPSHFDMYKDMIELAEINKETSPQGCYQLLCEAHIVVRTWFHRLRWMQKSGGGLKDDVYDKLVTTQELLNKSCLKLATYYVSSDKEIEWKLALPYYRLSGAQISTLIKHALEGSSSDSVIPPGLLFLLTEVLLRPTPDEENICLFICDEVNYVIDRMGVDKLAYIYLNSSCRHFFKYKKMYTHFHRALVVESPPLNAEEVLAFALTCTAMGDKERNEACEFIRSLSNVALSEILIEHHRVLVKIEPSGSGFSELAILIRNSAPETFVEVLVSLIKDGEASLGITLEHFLQSFVGSENNANFTMVLQLFLETYFVEYLENHEELRDSSDVKQALCTLIRSYLSSISSPIRFGNKNIDSDIFGPRDLYLELLPPFQHGGSRETLLDAESPEFWCQNSLLKLQSLLCSPVVVKDYHGIVLEYLSVYPETVGVLSLRIMCSDNPSAIVMLSESHPEVLLTFCKERISSEGDWRLILETLLGHLSNEPNHPHHEGWYSSVQEILNHLAQTLSLEMFMSVLPSSMQGNEDYQGYIQMCRKIQQAQQLQDRISCTGQHLLSTLSL